MKLIFIFYVFLCFFTTQIQAEEKSRLSIGFYYPSLRNLSTKTDIQRMSQDFNNRKLDMVIAPPPLLLITHFDTSLFSNGFVGVAEPRKPDQLLIITHQKNNESFVRLRSYQAT